MYWDCDHFVGNVRTKALIDTLFEHGIKAARSVRSKTDVRIKRR